MRTQARAKSRQPPARDHRPPFAPEVLALLSAASHEASAKVERAAADQAILLRCAAGSEAAFHELYARLAPTLFSMIFEIVQHQKDAEDVFQDVFVQLWKKAAAYDPERGTVFTWAVMIARHKAIDRFRASRRRNTLLENAATENAIMAPEAVAPADDLLMQRDEGKRVRAALREIPAAQSAAIQLAFFSGLTQSEIAQKLGAPLGTIKARIRRGLLALRDGLANNPGRAHSSPTRGEGLVVSPSIVA